MNVGEANRIRACLDCGAPGALLWRTTKGANTGRLLRICAACLREDEWHQYGLVERQPISGELLARGVREPVIDVQRPAVVAGQMDLFGRMSGEEQSR